MLPDHTLSYKVLRIIPHFSRSSAVILLASSVLLSACGRPDNRSVEQVASSIRARSATVESLKKAKRVREDGRGSLRAESGIYLEVSERRIVEQENYERDKIFRLLAKSYQVGRASVAQIFGKLALRSK